MCWVSGGKVEKQSKKDKMLINSVQLIYGVMLFSLAMDFSN